ncbi:ABC transporter ATP-binding protein [Paenibacillus xylanilyticus]|uniref:ABC transporter ATP-binding protein n=1 Tax=Paenibacillus xylanilyticus TaxID=248903 RepID=UPI003AB0D93B
MDKKKKMGIVLKLMKPFRWSFVNLFICVVATSIIAMSYPYIFSLLIDEVFYKKSIDFFILIVISYGVVFIGEQSLHFVLNAVWSYLMTRFVYDIRRKVVRKFIRAQADRLSRMETGEAMVNINQDTDEFMNLIHWNIFYLIANSIKVISAFCFIAVLNVKVALVVAVLVPISYFINQKINERAYKKTFIHREFYGKISSWVLEMLSGMREIKIFGQVRRNNSVFIGKQVKLTRAKIAKDRIEFISERINVLVVLVVQLTLFIFSSILVVSGSFSVGGVIATLMYYTIISDMFRNLAQAHMRLQKNVVSVNRVFAILGQSEERKTGDGAYSTRTSLDFRNVRFAYNEKPIFDQLSFTIGHREHVAVVGKSGTGKSSLIQLLQGFYEPDEGVVELGGVPIQQYPLKELRRMVGVVHQRPVMFKGTIRHNICMGDKHFTDDAIWEACKQAGIAQEIEKLPEQLDTFLNSNGEGLSGGQKQRISIARVLIRNPEIIVFDEATSALDGISEQALRQVIRSLRSRKTMITIAHNFSMIAEADRVIVLDQGSVVGMGKIEELMQNCSVFHDLYSEQKEWYAAYERT